MYLTITLLIRKKPISVNINLSSKKRKEWVGVCFCNIWVLYKDEVLSYVIKIKSKTKEKSQSGS